ncbi:MAG: diguanylate cyclase [Campylobacterota bacterium]|nr:diguanylate cyclase [Campylobacterota bacterium]
MSKWYSFNIKNELLVWFFAVSILPLILVSVINFFNLKSDYEENTKEHVSQILDSKVLKVKNYINGLKDGISIISMLPTTLDNFEKYSSEFNENRRNRVYHNSPFFDKVVEEEGFYGIFLIDLNGNIIYTQRAESDLYENLLEGPLKDSGLAWAYNRTRALLNTEISTFEYYAPSSEQASFISVPIFKQKQLIGIFAIQISKQRLFDVIINYKGLGESGEVIAGYLDKKKSVVASIPLRFKPNAFNDHFVLQSNVSVADDTPVKKAVLGNSGVDISYDYKEDKIVAAWKYIPELRWGMVIKINYDEVMQEAYNQILFNVLVLLAVIVVITVAIFIVTRHIVNPIQILTQKVNSISLGKDEPFSEEVSSLENEVGELAKSFNIMSKSLQESQNTIKNYATELEYKVDERTKELEEASEKLQVVNENMKKTLDIVDEYVIASATDLDGVITEASSALSKITGYSKDELIGKKHSILRHPDVPSALYKNLWKTIIAGKTWYGEIKNQKKDGSFYWVDVIIAPLFDKHNNIEGYSSIRQDITDKKLVEELSVTDQLTQISNRLYLENIFKNELNRATRYGKIFSVILLDIDKFKSVNDTYGHDVGDAILIAMVNILKQYVRATDILGRWGGEEFLIICPETTAINAKVVAEKLRVKIEEATFEVVGKKTCSFGVAEFKDTDISSKEVVKRADNALYEAKESGRNRVIVAQS